MVNLFQDLDARMRRAVQQENRSLSSGLSSNKKRKKKKKPQGRCCLLLVMLSPVVLVLMLMYVLSMYNGMVQYDEQQQKLSLRAQNEKQNRQKGDQEKELREQQLLRKRQADVARVAMRSEEEVAGGATTLVLTTSLGPIRIQMRPDLSKESVDYIHRLVESKECERCNFYRAEKDELLQGVMASEDVLVNTVLGLCPPGADSFAIENECPECGCHGPLMTRGSVAWADGDPGGPDFFIDAYTAPAEWWGTQHTNFGFIEDPASMAIVDKILEFPVEEEDSLDYLVDEIQFTMTLE
jgi:cyclophilin family peptidyl-prolyl cis-trans isomerase